MNKITVADITLREKHNTLSFKEKTEIARQLDKLNVDIIETPPVSGGKTDILFLHTISPIIKNSIISCPVDIMSGDVVSSFDAIKNAKKPRLNIIIPVSTVQMEYVCHKKPDKMLEIAADVIKNAVSICPDVEVSFMDSTRAETEFLNKVIAVALENGARTLNFCDTAGIMLPSELEDYIKALYKAVPALSEACVSVECSNELNMAVACALSCINAGVSQIKTIIDSPKCPDLLSVAHTFKSKADALSMSTKIDMTALENSIKNLSHITNSKAYKNTGFGENSKNDTVYDEEIKLSQHDNIESIAKTISKMGYELSEEDLNKVFTEFSKIVSKKPVSVKELDAIVASTAMQVPPTYKLKSYVINSGNIISSTANIEMIKNNETLQGYCVGDGPIDASFKAIEQITGHHYELDDFQIQSVTRGHEAMGESVVKLRHEGKLFSGKGTSTDIVGASINAYINALNKICFEEDVR